MVNFGIIGCGKIGMRHAEFIQKMDGVKLVAVSDVLTERIDKFKENCKTYLNYDDLLKDAEVDIVNICTPSGMHAQMSMDALNARKHVICEKPMALSTEDCDRMIETADKTGKKLFIVKQNRFNRPIQILRQAIDSGRLGKIHTITSNVMWNRHSGYYAEADWRGTKSLDGGALATQASHFVDVMQWFGGPVKSVFAKTEKFVHENIEAEDTGAVMIKFDSGTLGMMYYTTAVYHKNMEGSITVLGTKGSVKIGGEYLNKIEHWDIEGFSLPENSTETAKANDYGNYRGSASKHDCVFREVIKKIIGDGNNNFVDGLEGKKTVEIIEAVHESAENGKEVFLKKASINL